MYYAPSYMQTTAGQFILNLAETTDDNQAAHLLAATAAANPNVPDILATAVAQAPAMAQMVGTPTSPQQVSC